MRSATILAALMTVSVPAMAQLSPASARPDVRLETLRTVALRVNAISEGDRLGRAGFDRAKVAAVVAQELEALGIRTAETGADAQLDVDWICAGPDAGKMGCSVRLRVLALEPGREGGALATTWQVAATPRSLFHRDGWPQMASDAVAITREVGADLAYQVKMSRARYAMN